MHNVSRVINPQIIIAGPGTSLIVGELGQFLTIASLHALRASLQLATRPPTSRLYFTMSTLKRKADAAASQSDTKKTKANGNIASFFGAAPKPAASTNSAPEPVASKFDKEKWVAGLTDEQKELLKLEIETLDDSWLAHLKDDITTTEFLGLKRFLKAETNAKKKWFPPAEDVYSW